MVLTVPGSSSMIVPVAGTLLMTTGVFGSTEAAWVKKLEVRMSSLPSPLMSASTTLMGTAPTENVCGVVNEGVVAPGAVVFKNTTAAGA